MPILLDGASYSEESILTGGFIEAAQAALDNEDPSDESIREEAALDSDQNNRYISDVLMLNNTADIVEAGISNSLSSEDFAAYSTMLANSFRLLDVSYDVNNSATQTFENYVSSVSSLETGVKQARYAAEVLRKQHALSQESAAGRAVYNLSSMLSTFNMVSERVSRNIARFQTNGASERVISNPNYAGALGIDKSHCSASDALQFMEHRLNTIEVQNFREGIAEVTECCKAINKMLGHVSFIHNSPEVKDASAKLRSVVKVIADMEGRLVEPKIVKCELEPLSISQVAKLNTIVKNVYSQRSFDQLMYEYKSSVETMALLFYSALFLRLLKFFSPDLIVTIKSVLSVNKMSYICKHTLYHNKHFLNGIARYVADSTR